MLTLTHLRSALAAHTPVILPDGDRGRAVVGAVLQDCDGELRLLFIERATREGDPWSGQIAFPGGRVEPGDREIRTTAERETREEVGIDLGEAELIGRLSDLRGRPIPIVVSALVFHIKESCHFRPGEEVKEAFWLKVSELVDPARRTTLRRIRDGEERVLPAIQLPGTTRPPLWGMTYEIVAMLFDIAGRPIR